jgi:hypothetical protein
MLAINQTVDNDIKLCKEEDVPGKTIRGVVSDID